MFDAEREGVVDHLDLESLLRGWGGEGVVPLGALGEGRDEAGKDREDHQTVKGHGRIAEVRNVICHSLPERGE